MCFFRKKTKSAEIVSENRRLIETNSKSINALVVLAKNDGVLVRKLRELQERIKYLVPSDKREVIDFDEKIKEMIAEIRSAMTNNAPDARRIVDNYIEELELAINDRNVEL